MRILCSYFSLFYHFRSMFSWMLFCPFFLASGQSFTIASYNVENLMDTLDNPRANDNDFLPKGKNQWNTEKYRTKIKNLAKVISELGDKDGPELLGLTEIENRQVIEDLLKDKELKNKKYAIVHADSKDERGIDVAFLYKQDRFTLVSWKTISAALDKIPTHTRDILLVKGVLGGDTIVVMVNHWPSRRSGKEVSEPKRITMALLVREALDSLSQKEYRYPVLILGDFNDEPGDKSIREVLIARPDWTAAGKEGLLNPFEKSWNNGDGSYLYQHKWNMLDQILLGTGWRNGRWELISSAVYHPDWMHYQKDKKQGPFKTFHNGKYKGGYSDHFPVYIVLKQLH